MAEEEKRDSHHSHHENTGSPHKSHENKKQEHEIKQANEKPKEEEYREMLQRLQAEFENFRKRSEKENNEFMKFAGAGIITEFLPLVDSVKGGIGQAKKSGNREMLEGFESVLKQIQQILEKNGVKKIECAGKKFDHNLHETLMTYKDGEKEDEIILEELQPGYLMNGKVLRPAKVKVNKK